MKTTWKYLLPIMILLAACNSQIGSTQTEYVEFTSIPAQFQYPASATFSILSWNVEHFVDAYDDPYIKNNREDNPPENMDIRRMLFLKTLRKANADIVLLQEFESAKYLQQLAKDSLLEMGYLFFADAPSHTWYMNVVVMSRYPMGVLQAYGNVTTPLPGYLDADGNEETQNQINTRMWSLDIFPAPDYHFNLTGVHLKAGRSERDVAMRKGQIHFLVSQYNKILEQNTQANLMMAGDFNAIPESEELSILLAGSQLKQNFIDFIDPNTYSHPADSPRWRLDYMLVNQNMAREFVTGKMEVSYFFDKDTMRLISDHLPLMGTFYRNDL